MGNDRTELAARMERAMNSQLSDKEYTSQARALLFNLKDIRNPMFRFKLWIGAIKPEDVPTLTPEDMASDETNGQRRRYREEATAAVTDRGETSFIVNDTFRQIKRRRLF